MNRARDFGSVTVIIPTLGRPELLRALASVQAQSVSPDRVLLVDDSTGPADPSLDSLGVDVVRTTGRCGAAAARNVGMTLSDTDFIAFLDDDDEWLPDHLLNALQAFDTDPELDVYACAARVLDSGAERIQPAVPYQGGGLENHFYGRVVWRGRSRRIVTPGLVARRWVTSVRMDETLVSSEDTWWLLTIEREGAVIRQFPAVGVVVHAMGERTASRINDQSTVEWAARLNSHYPGRGADFLVGVARGRCRSGDPRGVIGTLRLQRRVNGITLRHRLLTLAAVMLAGVLSLARPQEQASRVATVVRLLSSTVLAQVAVLAATIASAAWLTPRDFAWFGAAMGLAGILNSINTLTIETRLAVVGAATISHLLRTGLAFCLALSAAAAATAILLATNGHRDWSIVLAFGIAGSVVYACQQVLTTLALRDGRHDVLVRSRVAQGSVNAVLILVLSVSPMPGYVALSSAWLASILVGLLVSLRGWKPPLPAAWTMRSLDVSVTRAEVGMQPVTGFLAGVTVQIPLVVLPMVASASLAGSWALSSRILGAAVMASFSAVQPVYFSTAAEYVRERAFPQLAAWHRRWAFLLTALTLPGFAVAGLTIALGLPLLGSQWLDARVLVAPACLYWGSQFFGLPLSQTLLLVGRIRLQLVWTVVRFAAAVAAFALWPVWGAMASIWAWSIVCVATYLVLTVLQSRVLRVMADNETTSAALGVALVN